MRSQRTKESAGERKESAQDIINAAWGDIINTENDSRGMHTTTKLHVNEGRSAEVSLVGVRAFCVVASETHLYCDNSWQRLTGVSSTFDGDTQGAGTLCHPH